MIKLMIDFLKWVGSVIEDRKGNISSKRVGFFWCLWMLNRTVSQTEVNEVVIWGIVGLAFGLVGLAIPERLATIKKENENK